MLTPQKITAVCVELGTMGWRQARLTRPLRKETSSAPLLALRWRSSAGWDARGRVWRGTGAYAGSDLSCFGRAGCVRLTRCLAEPAV